MEGNKSEQLRAALADIDPLVAEWADRFVFGEVWAGQALEHRDRVLVAATATAALGLHDQLRVYLHGALQEGISFDELSEALRMLTVYAGFPRAIAALSILRHAAESETRRASSD